MRMNHWIGAMLLLAVGGVGHGMWTHRWSSPLAEQAGRNLLADEHLTLTDWKAGEFVPVAEREIPRGTSVVCRHFTHGPSQRRVVVSVTSGTPGVVAAHTPDVCFLGSGYRLKGPPTKQSLPLAAGGTADFYVADFEKTTSTGTETVRCRWSWSADGAWHAPDYPRLYFARSQASQPVLHKLYIVHPLGTDEANRKDPYREFSAELAAGMGQALRR